jgi:hypothetical protein
MTANRKWNVYNLVDPRDGEVFYVGCTVNTLGRLSNHNSDPASAAWPRCSEIRDAGERAILVVQAIFWDMVAALEFENSLIREASKAVNRVCHLPECECRRRHNSETWDHMARYRANLKKRAKGK